MWIPRTDFISQLEVEEDELWRKLELLGGNEELDDNWAAGVFEFPAQDGLFENIFEDIGILNDEYDNLLGYSSPDEEEEGEVVILGGVQVDLGIVGELPPLLLFDEEEEEEEDEPDLESDDSGYDSMFSDEEVEEEEEEEVAEQVSVERQGNGDDNHGESAPSTSGLGPSTKRTREEDYGESAPSTSGLGPSTKRTREEDYGESAPSTSGLGPSMKRTREEDYGESAPSTSGLGPSTNYSRRGYCVWSPPSTPGLSFSPHRLYWQSAEDSDSD